MTENKARKVMVVEDEPLIRMLAVDMLEMLGFDVLEAAAGGEALAISPDDLGRLHAMIIDLGLPDRPGEEVIRLMLAKRPDLPVIVTTGSDAVAIAQRLRGQGHIRVLEKPYQYRDVERVMAALAVAG